MQIDYLLFDLDDTLYPPSSGLWDAIGERINQFLLDNIDIAPDAVKTVRDDLFHRFGTTLRGLQVEHGINPYKYLNYVHNVPLEAYLMPNPTVRNVLSQIKSHKVIFTNADRNHALRVIERLRLDGIFERVIDVMDVAPHCKPQPEAYTRALNLLCDPLPSQCVVIDDSPRNINTASELGFYTILVGSHDGHEVNASAVIGTLEDLQNLAEIPFMRGIWR
jgi:pyrimidine 5'-nucleotidase